MSKFKKGDWVRHTDGRCLQILKIEGNNFTPIDNCQRFGGNYHIDHLKPWKPEPDEFIWENYYGLMQIIKQNDTGDYQCKKLFQTGNIDRLNILNMEPFIGKLPSFIKEK